MIIDWLRKQVKDAPEISASKHEGRLVREDKSNAVNRLIDVLQKVHEDPDHEISVSRLPRR